MLNHWHFRVSNNYGCYCEGCSYACKRTNLSNNGPTCKLHSKVGFLRNYPFLPGTPPYLSGMARILMTLSMQCQSSWEWMACTGVLPVWISWIDSPIWIGESIVLWVDLVAYILHLPREGIIQFLVDCQDSESGGFRPVQNHDPHLLNTLSAVQVIWFSVNTFAQNSSHRWQLSLIVWTRSTATEL